MRNLFASTALALGLTLTPALATEMKIEVAGGTTGIVIIDLADDTAPEHVKRLVELTKSGAYDGVIFHRVIDGFMAQTGDVKYGKINDADVQRAGTGGSDLPDLKAEFSDTPFERGTVGMARTQDPDSANSQFFIMFAPAPHLNNQYTVVGKVTSGMDVIDAVKRGTGPNGTVVGEPDYMQKVTILE